MQLPAQLAPALHEECLVDRLVAHPHHRIVGELHPQAPGDLLRRPPSLEPRRDLSSERPMRELRRLRAPRLVPGASVGEPTPVALTTAVGGDLSGHRRHGSTDRRRDRREALAALEPGPNLLALPQ